MNGTFNLRANLLIKRALSAGSITGPRVIQDGTRVSSDVEDLNFTN